MRKIRLCLTVAAIVCATVFSALGQSSDTATAGSLDALSSSSKPLGACPLKHTDVSAEISGFLARVRVRQEFENNFSEKIEAVYVFPLPQMAAVDAMTMQVGDRTVRGRILRREEAKETYEAAKSRGQVASLLDQERPNIFTQSVANILPGEKITVEISYVETLKYDNGVYEFVFPTVVGSRYVPGAPTGQQAGGFAPDTTGVPDGSRITPMPAATRAGHDISIAVNLDAGVPLESIASNSHQIETAMLNPNRAAVKLKTERTIPNKDFVLRYDVAGKRISDALLTHRTDKGGFFTLILQPPDEVTAADVTPKEIVFVLDTSGSMEGFPIEKAKEAMKLALDGLHPNDTFNLITFAGDTHVLFPQPVAATRANLVKAGQFLESRAGSGGTEMMKAITAALEPTKSQQHVRVVCFMTDGYVGNDLEIIGEIQKHPNARVFSFGIGSSVNRFLLDKMAEAGRGEVEYVALDDDGSAAARRFHERVRSPLLTDVSVDWNGLPVADVYPKRSGDLFSAKPVIIHGRYTNAANGTIRLRGKQAGREIVREIPVNLPANEPTHDVLATLWARTRIDDLMAEDYAGIQSGNTKPDVKETIVGLGLEYKLLTQFTSFVAVEELIVTDGGQPRRIEVPVEMPAGASSEGVSGNEDTPFRRMETISALSRPPQVTFNRGAGGMGGGSANRKMRVAAKPASPPPLRPRRTSVPTVLGTTNKDASGGGGDPDAPSGDVPKVVSKGVLNGRATSLPRPAFPPAAKAVRASGAVSVQVTIDENGNVIAANAVGGHPLLKAAAVAAARGAKFSPTRLSGQPVKVNGTIVYNFSPTFQMPTVTVDALQDPSGKTIELTPEEQRRQRLEAKSHPIIFAVIERLRLKEPSPTPDEATFVSNGKAEVRVYFDDKTPEAIAELQKLGFEIVLDPKTTKFIVGRIAIENLAALAKLSSVSFIASSAKN